MSGPKTNERPRGARTDHPGTRAVHRHARVSAYKVREVLDLIRDHPVSEAVEILRFSERDAAQLVGKVLNSAVANAEHNDELDPDELFVSACFADEGTTIKRWRPRARGRATRIRKRTSHITVIVARLPEDRLQRLVARRRAEMAAQRARRVAGARKSTPAAGDTRSRRLRRRRGAEEATEGHEAEGAEATDNAETKADNAETKADKAKTTAATDKAETEETTAEKMTAEETTKDTVSDEKDDKGATDEEGK